jgi:hypothetical protein
MDHHSSGCLLAEKFPTFASGRQDRGQVNSSDFRPQFRLTRQGNLLRTLFERADKLQQTLVCFASR